MRLKLSVVVPTLNAEKELPELLISLLNQAIKPDEILIIDSSSEDKTVELASSFPRTKIHVINRKNFNHGLTRHRAFEMSSGDYVCFLTQDALPADSGYLHRLIEPFEGDDMIALSYGRQLPKKGARRFEQLIREFNYPSLSSIRSKEDLEDIGIKTYYSSDVCSCYRRDLYFECGGFSEVNTNEDMLMAAQFIRAGYKVAYASKACVFHSHNLSFLEQYRRNKEIGIFLAAHDEIFGGLKETKEGVQLVKYVSSQLIKEKSAGELLAFLMDCVARIMGNKVGKNRGSKDV